MKRMTLPDTINWQANLRSSMFKIGLQLRLTQSMLEYLCAVADDVKWNRAYMKGDQQFPDNWIASENSLERRGLIIRKPRETINGVLTKRGERDYRTYSLYVLTPAGKLVVELAKLAGVFEEANIALERKRA